MSRKRQQDVTLSQYNHRVDYWLTRIIRLAASSIKWEGLPKEIDTTQLERILATNPSAIVVKDPELDIYMCGTNGSVGRYNIYNVPTNRKAIFLNGVQYNSDIENSVIVYDNVYRMSNMIWWRTIAEDMSNMDMAIRVNINTQRTMPIIPTSQQQKLTIENLYQDVLNNMPYALVDENVVDVEKLKSALVFDNVRSYTADKIMATQKEYWNRCLTMIGINNLNIEKKERTTVPEMNANLDEIATMRRDRLNARQRAADQMNELWGLNVKVSYYADEMCVEGGIINDAKTGDSNGRTHSEDTEIDVEE